MRVHLIAIGGSAMHNVALALQENGHEVSGSDDQIFEPSKGRLKAKGLLPTEEGWNPNRITSDLDVVILGMHARKNNPELARAIEVGIPVKSYPEFFYEECKNKKRVVIAGSHGKTTITSMILHVLLAQNIQFDYLVGAQLAGFDTMVQISDAPIVIIEGDEYLSSPIDLKPKFLWYKPHITCISGIAWDHINVFKTEADYDLQFQLYLNSVEPGGKVFGCGSDEKVVELLKANPKLGGELYSPSNIEERKGVFYYGGLESEIELKVQGAHNIKNLFAAEKMCLELGVESDDFWKAIASFTGAAKRLEPIPTQSFKAVFKDFAHAPSKVRATNQALYELYGDKLVSILELHTFSSLNKTFLPQYKGAMGETKKKWVFFDPKSVEHKQLPALSKEDVWAAFNDDTLDVFTDSDELFRQIKKCDPESVLLMMSSGNWSGKKLEEELK